MINDEFSLVQNVEKVMEHFPSFDFRDKDPLVHYASGATECGRKITYKSLGVEESNPIDLRGHYRMRFGSWLEAGFLKEILSKMPIVGVETLSSQASTGEHGSFYGTSWHGYSDMIIAYRDKDRLKPVILEIKSKVGYGADATYREWLAVGPQPDQTWGYAQQLGLYLRKAYFATKDNPKFSSPIQDGILFYLLYGDSFTGCVEFQASYVPDRDSVLFYKVVCPEVTQFNQVLSFEIKLEDIAKRWADTDNYLKRKELAPPSYHRRYSLDDPRVEAATKTDLKKAIDGELVIGDMQCKYCSFKDRCANDLNIELSYTTTEKEVLSDILNSKPVFKRGSKK